MDIVAVFQTWHIGDGNYPPLEKEQLVNLSFELEEIGIAASEGRPTEEFVHTGGGLHRFRARVLRQYTGAVEDSDTSLIVLESCGFRFYVSLNGPAPDDLRGCSVVQGPGYLALDSYDWVQFLEWYEDPPDLFYQLRVRRIWKPRDYASSFCPESAEEIDTMVGRAFRSEPYYIVEFTNEGVPRDPTPRTFLAPSVRKDETFE